MANARSRKAAPNRPGDSRDSVSADADGDRPPPGKKTAATKRAPQESGATASKPTGTAAKKGSASTAAKGPGTAAGKDAGSPGRRFGDGGSAGSRKAAPPTKKSGGGRRTRPAPPVRVAQPKPWGMIAATLAVLLFAGGAIGYAVVQANSTEAVPEDVSDIEALSVYEYAAGQEHVATDVTYTETPPVGGPHDGYWADCDGAVYQEQVRSENAVHSLEHGAVWITYNPDDISDADLEALSGYVQGQPYTLLSPYAGLPSPISLQSWNHQLFVDAADDPRISQFIALLRQNPEKYPEVGASCSQPLFLLDPVLEGESSRVPDTGAPETDDPSALSDSSPSTRPEEDQQ